jgi:serine/threonine-protein kinase RsbW
MRGISAPVVRDDDGHPRAAAMPIGSDMLTTRAEPYLDRLIGLRREACGALDGTADVALCLVQPLTATSVRLARELIGEALDELGVGPACRGDIQIAVGEACTNAVVHGRGGTCYRVAIWVDGLDCLVEIADDGGGFELHEPPKRPDPRAEHGYGLFLITTAVDDWRITRRQPRGTRVLLARRLDPTTAD